MDLCGVHLSLDDVEDGDVAVVGLTVSACGHHDIFRLQEPPHHIQNCSLPHACHRLIGGQRCVSSHEEVEARSGDEGCNQSNQVIVHVSRVTEGCCAC